MDSYQAIYDAVRSRISSCDIGSLFQEAIRNMDISFQADMMKETFRQAVYECQEEYIRPCVLFKPELFKDGNQWCALLGANLQEGVSGFGETPALAMRAFDKAWIGKE